MSGSLAGVVAVIAPFVVVGVVLALAGLADATRSRERIRIGLGLFGLAGWIVVFVAHVRSGGSWVMPVSSLLCRGVLAALPGLNARGRGV